MPLATKNNAIIVKDGKLAENCGCCGEWYCCAERNCFPDQITSILVNIQAEDWYENSSFFTSGFRGSLASGQYVLPKVVISNSFAYGGPPTYATSQLLNLTTNLIELTMTFGVADCLSSFSWSLSLGFRESIWYGNDADFTTSKLWDSRSLAFPTFAGGVVSGTSSTGLSPINSSSSASFSFSSGRRVSFGNPVAQISVSIT